MADLLSQLKRQRPEALRVTVAGKEEPVAVAVQASKRDKWKRALDVVSKLPWVRLELLGRGGALIDVIEPDDAPGAGAGDESTSKSPEERWLGMMIEAQRLALQQQQAMLEPLVSGYVSLANSLGSRLSALESRYDKVLRSAYDSALLRAQMEAEGDGDPVDGLASQVLSLIEKREGGGKRTKQTKPAQRPVLQLGGDAVTDGDSIDDDDAREAS